MHGNTVDSTKLMINVNRTDFDSRCLSRVVLKRGLLTKRSQTLKYAVDGMDVADKLS